MFSEASVKTQTQQVGRPLERVLTKPRRFTKEAGAIGMKHLILGILLLACAACTTGSGKYLWRVRDFALAPGPRVHFLRPNQTDALTMSTQTVQKLLLAHLRISRTANIQAELLVIEDTDPNAFAGLVNGRRVVAINTAMIRLIGDDIDAYAALLGHESAHWARNHGGSREARSNTLQGFSTLAGLGLSAVGVPAAGWITGLGADLIDASYSRDDEREADALAIDYMLANGFEPEGAVRLHEKMLKSSGAVRVPFLSGHPSGEERIENLKKLIAAKKSRPDWDDRDTGNKEPFDF
jgi:Zn-dependent protease with chaperone function